MKIRNGFVSNSSSSSFVIVCLKEVHDKVVKKLHPYYQAWIEQRLQFDEQKFLGKTIVKTSIHISTEDCEPIEWNKKFPPEAEEYDGYGEEDVAKKWVDDNSVINIYVKELKKESNDVIFEEIQG